MKAISNQNRFFSRNQSNLSVGRLIQTITTRSQKQSNKYGQNIKFRIQSTASTHNNTCPIFESIHKNTEH